MEFILGVLAAGFWAEVLFFGVLSLALLGTALSRDTTGDVTGVGSFIKWVTVICLVGVSVICSDQLGLWPNLKLSLIGIAEYAGIGLVYSLIEFFWTIRKSSKWYAERWTEWFMADNYESVSRFITQYPKYQFGVIRIRKAEGSNVPQPYVHKATLAAHIADWTWFWPFHAVCLLLGDLLVRVWNYASDLFTAIANWFVKLSFGKVFTTPVDKS